MLSNAEITIEKGDICFGCQVVTSSRTAVIFVALLMLSICAFAIAIFTLILSTSMLQLIKYLRQLYKC